MFSLRWVLNKVGINKQNVIKRQDRDAIVDSE